MPTGKYPRNQTAIEYLESRSICRPDGCIVWIAGKTNKGYGLGNKDGIKTTAHRLSYLINVGKIPNGMGVEYAGNVQQSVQESSARGNHF